jgi:hypothetical protein
LQPIYHPRDSVAHVCDVEIEQVAEPKPAEPEITQELGAMDGKDRLDRLELDHNEIFNEKIDPVSVIDDKIFVPNWDQDLSLS